MGIIERNLTVSGQKSKKVLAFFDSGSSFSIINPKILKDIGYLKKIKTKITLELGDGSKMFVKDSVILGIKLNKNDYYFKFLVAPISEKMVIGVDFLQEFGHTLEFKRDRIIAKNLHLKNIRGKYVL